MGDSEKKKKSSASIILIIGFIAALITLFVFITGMNLPDLFSNEQLPRKENNASGNPGESNNPSGSSETDKEGGATNANRDAPPALKNFPKSTYEGTNTAVFARAYYGRESTPAYTNEEVLFVEYEMTGWSSGEIWLHYMDVATGKDVYYYGPVPSWCKASLITKYHFTDGHSYIVYFTDFSGNIVSDSFILIDYKMLDPTIYYSKEYSGRLPNTSRYNDYGDGDTRYNCYGYYELK